MSHKTPIILIFTFSIVLISGCIQEKKTTESVSQEPEEISQEPEIFQEPSAVASVLIKDQQITDGAITVENVVSEGSGWIVIYTEEGGAPGEIIGHAAVDAGENLNVKVNVDASKATATLYAMLHKDKGTAGKAEFPAPDTPATSELVGEPVVSTFKVTQ